MADNVILTGALLKYKSWLKWSSKNFVLTSEALTYSSQSRNEGYWHIKNIRVENDSSSAFNVINTATNTIMYLKAPSFEEKRQWVSAINQQAANILYTGCLKKWTNVIKGWQQRYFILYKNRLCYYLNEESVGTRRGTIYLVNRKVTVTGSSSRNGFDVMSAHGNTVWYLKASSEEEQKTWRSKIDKIINDIPASAPELERGASSWSLSSTGSKIADSAESPALPSAPPLPSSAPSSTRDEDSDQESRYRKDLECTICLELLNEPTTLSCGHSFCRTCLANLWATDRSRFLCPSCRQMIHSVPAVNIALQNLIPVLYEDEERENETSENREAFDNFFNDNGSSSNQGQSTGRQTYTQTNLEYEFLKRGMCLIFLLWVGSKILSPFMPGNYHRPHVPDIAEEVEAADENSTESYYSLDSRNTMVFLMIGGLQCPRFLGWYIMLFWYNGIFYPALKVISHMLNQSVGFALQLKVMIWGAVVPYVWLIPIFVHEQQYLLALLSAAISAVELWELFFVIRQLIYLQRDREQYFMSTVKRESGISLLRLLFARAISYLPWSWLPDVLYYIALLFITGDMMSKYATRVRGLLARTRAIRNNPPGVHISTISVNRDNLQLIVQ